MAASKKNNQSSNQKNIHNEQLNFFIPPPRVSMPQFPIPRELEVVVKSNLSTRVPLPEKSVYFLRIVKNLQKNDGSQLKESNHLKMLKLALYLEEIQNNIDMQMYDINNGKIHRIIKSDYFKIYVENLMEDRPSVRPNDIVEVREAKVLYLMIVTNVMDNHIIVAGGKCFCENYDKDKKYNIRFRFQNYTLRCCHYALTLVHLYKLTPHFFPPKRPTFSNSSCQDHWFNKMIETNPEQKQAVLNIKYKTSFPAPYILYGPPGTGKTATLVESICQIWNNCSSEHILVCTPSNSAGDLITKRLLKYIPHNNLFRMYSPSKEGSHIDEEIIKCSNYVDGQIMMLPEELMMLKRIVITTLCAATRLIFLHFREKHFSYIFIDEAGQATEPESMIPFNLLSSTREGRIGRLHGQVIIAGDPQQLGPGIRSKFAQPILGKSMMERLMDCEPYKKNEHDRYNPSYITKLLRNYRSHPDIIHVSNTLFYENELLTFGDENIRKAEGWKELVNPTFPIIFHGIEGHEVKDTKSPSVYNIEEVKIVVEYVRRLVGQKFKNHIVTQDDIGIITPFAAQRLKLHKALNEQDYGNINVGTVELFQGQEKDIIILSTVRSKLFYHDKKMHIGFLSNPKRFNVALTRAKALLIVVGNPTILQTDESWCYLLNFCKRNNACRGRQFNYHHDIEHKMQNLHINNNSKDLPPVYNDISLDFIQIDDGIMQSPEGSVVDESEYSNTSTRKNNFTTNSYRTPTNRRNTRPPTLLSEAFTIKTESDIKLEKQLAKKNKKKAKCKN